MKSGIFLKSSLLFNSFYYLLCLETKLYGSITQKQEQLWMWKFQCLLFVMKQSYICYYVNCITVPRSWFTLASFSESFITGLRQLISFKYWKLRVTSYHIVLSSSLEVSPEVEWKFKASVEVIATSKRLLSGPLITQVKAHGT